MRHDDLVQMLYDLVESDHLLTKSDVLRAVEKPWQYEATWALLLKRRDADQVTQPAWMPPF